MKKNITTILLAIVLLGLSYGVTMFQEWNREYMKKQKVKEEIQTIYKCIKKDKEEIAKFKKSIEESDINSHKIRTAKIYIKYYNREIESHYLELERLLNKVLVNGNELENLNP